MQAVAQKVLDKLNEEFWDELCGTGLARLVGITDNSPESLRKFDDAYYDLYPYLLPLVKPQSLKGKKVLEIGLGYGTLSQTLAESGCDYHGLDIAEGPVRMINHRLNYLKLPENARKGNILECPFEDDYFDVVVSIGCFHHTGNVQQCFDETYRVLKPGGRAVLMVYSKYSFRQWSNNFRKTLGSLFQEKIGLRKLSEKESYYYDHDSTGRVAPEVILTSIYQLKKMLNRYTQVNFYKQNSDSVMKIPRKWLLWNLGRLMGLDIYIEARKDKKGSTSV